MVRTCEYLGLSLDQNETRLMQKVDIAIANYSIESRW